MTTDTTIEQLPLAQYVERAYLDYSMSVILDRALPHLSDGLKPVQRRIIYAMSELGLKSIAKYKKSARTVGDVLGKFHPHGDMACYEALVLMAQPFSYRYPLIEGQGNFGSSDDPKSFAAMRYTESRLSPYAELLLSELEAGTVDWTLNFDGTLREPLLLPARLPNIILNGTTGIAVGMATDIPSHQLNEVVNALVHLIDHPDATLADICKHIKGPDFPTQAEIITPSADIRAIYRTGSGTIRMRATYTREEDVLIITALPHQTSGAKVLEQIAAQIQDKKLPWVADLRDESDHENPTRLVIIPRSNRVDQEALMNHLFATTDLERHYRVNLNIIGCDGRPQVKNLLQILTEWLAYRLGTVQRRLQHRLDVIMHRLLLLEGLLIIYSHLEEVIRIIRKEDEPKLLLMKRFKLNDEQAEAILNTRLRYLAKLEEASIRKEYVTLQQEQSEIEKILKNKERLKQLVRAELLADAKKYGDKRQSPLIVRQAAEAFQETELLPTEPITIILSKHGWVRAAKGHEMDPTTLSYKSGDQLLATSQGRSNQQVIFIDSTGRAYSLPAHTLPSARGQGEPLTGKLNPAAGVSFVGVLFHEPDQWIVLASSKGYGFLVLCNELLSKNRSGKAVLTVAQGDYALMPAIIAGKIENYYVAVVTNKGYLLIFKLHALPQLNKGKGNKLIALPKNKEETVVAIAVMREEQSLRIDSEHHKPLILSPTHWQHYVGERAYRGTMLPKNYRQVRAMHTSIA